MDGKESFPACSDEKEEFTSIVSSLQAEFARLLEILLSDQSEILSQFNERSRSRVINCENDGRELEILIGDTENQYLYMTIRRNILDDTKELREIISDGKYDSARAELTDLINQVLTCSKLAKKNSAGYPLVIAEEAEVILKSHGHTRGQLIIHSMFKLLAKRKLAVLYLMKKMKMKKKEEKMSKKNGIQAKIRGNSFLKTAKEPSK